MAKYKFKIKMKIAKEYLLESTGYMALEQPLLVQLFLEHDRCNGTLFILERNDINGVVRLH